MIYEVLCLETEWFWQIYLVIFYLNMALISQKLTESIQKNFEYFYIDASKFGLAHFIFKKNIHMEAKELMMEFFKCFSHSMMDLYLIKLKICPN